mgnify:CR=1 FL=1|tara:strand:+ start:363 stop:605 length:243 start_codon:yes stop_codon:yes gene_type:complete
MDPDDITLNNTSQMFEYERMSREIGDCNDVEKLKQMVRYIVKLEMKTREVYSMLLKDLVKAEYSYSDVLGLDNSIGDVKS